MCICAVPRTPVEGVNVYARKDAKDFKQVSLFFEDRGVRFKHMDVAEDPDDLAKMMSLSGQQDAVVVEIGKRIFVGFTPDELERVLP
jgi:hypothetical protein